MRALEVKEGPHNPPDILEGQGKRKKRGFFEKKIENTRVESKEVENNKNLQEFDQQGKVIEHLAKELTKKGLKGYDAFSAIGIYDSDKRDISDNVKKNDEYIRYKNNTYAWQCGYDMEDMIKKYEEYILGFKEAKDLFLKQKEQVKNVNIGVKEFNDVDKLFESLQQKSSTRAKDVQQQINSIQELARGQLTSAISRLKPSQKFSSYLKEAEKRKEELGNNKLLETHYKKIEEVLKTKDDKKWTEGQKKLLTDTKKLCKELKDKLDKAIGDEEVYHQHIKNICDKIAPNRKLDDNIKQELEQLINCARNVQMAEQELCNCEKAVAKLIRDNKLGKQKSALERLHKISEKDTLDQIKDMIEQGETYLYIHAPAGKVVINGIFWHMHRIEDVKSAGEGKTKIEWDTNRANLVIETITRDGKQTEERPYVKTLANGDIESENFRLRFVTPYAGGTNRKEAKLIIERKQENGEWKKEEQDVNLITLRSIRVKEVYEGGKLTVTVRQEDDVAPDIADTELLHSKILISKAGFEPEKAQRMYMMHLPSQSIIFPNGRRMSFDDFKWNAIRDDGDGIGLKCRTQGPTVDLPYFSVSMAGQDLQSPEMMEGTRGLNSKIREHLSSAFGLLKDAIEKGDENLLERTFCHVENTISHNISQLESLKNAYRDPPKERNHRPQVQIEQIDRAMGHLPEFLKEGEEMCKEVGNYGEKLNKKIQKIDLKNDTQKRELRYEIEDVYDLKETFKVGLLEDLNLDDILKIAREAGEAAHKIEEVKSPGTAEKAQVDAENTIIKEFIKARDAYRKNESLDAFRTAIQENIFQYKITLQAKAEIVENVKKYASEKGNISEEKKKFIKKQEISALEAKKAEIVKEQKDKIVNYIKKKDLKDSTAEKTGKIRRYTEKIDNEVKEAIKLSKAREEDEYKQYECAIKAAIETAFELEKYGNDRKDIEKESGDNVEEWLENTRKKLDEAPKCIEQAAIDKILNLKTDIEPEIAEEIRESAEKVKKDFKEDNKIDQHKIAIEAAIKVAYAHGIKPEKEESVENWIKNAREEFDKELKGVKRATIEKVKKDIESEEDKQNLKKQIDDAHEKLKKARDDAKASAQSKWNNDKERGNLLTKAKLDEIENELDKLPEKEKGTAGMRIAVKKAYEIKEKVEPGVWIGEIPKELGDANNSADEIKKIAEEWAQKLSKVGRTREFDGAELMRERRRLKSYATDPSGGLDERYDHLVKQARLKQIEDIIDNDPKVHYSYRIMLNIARAYEAALEDNYFWKHDKNKAKIEGVLHYLQNVKTEVEDHEGELGKLRADFLHQVVNFVRSGMKAAKDRQANRILLPFVVRAQRVLEADLDNLELVRQVLDSKTPADEAKKIKDVLNDKLSAESQRSALGLDEIRRDAEKIAEDLGEVIENRLMKNGRFDFGELEKLRPSEIQAWRSQILQNFHKKAETIFEATVHGLNNEQRAIMERNRASLVDKTVERLWNDYKKLEDKNFQLYKIGKFAKEVDKQRWMDAMVSWFLTFMQGTVQSSNRGANIFINQIEKILKESV